MEKLYLGYYSMNLNRVEKQKMIYLTLFEKENKDINELSKFLTDNLL